MRPETERKRPRSLRDHLDERDIGDLITAYREGATAASLAVAHDLRSYECQAPPAHRRCPPYATHSTSYEGNADRDASIAAHSLPAFTARTAACADTSAAAKNQCGRH